MKQMFQANCRAVLIGSLPMDNHREATELMLRYTPDIPLWVQLPKNPQEGMIEQFLPGLPSLKKTDNKVFIDTSNTLFHNELAGFFEDYLNAAEAPMLHEATRFALTHETAQGFFSFIDIVQSLSHQPYAVKGQITGPITMGIGLKDQQGRSVFYDDTLRDAVIKLIALKARWQVEKLKPLAKHCIIFFDEPGIVGFGSSAFISITREQIHAALQEPIAAVHVAGGIAGIHICANGDWSLALETDVDIISFDAYNYFDKFILYSDLIRNFIRNGKTIAWGIIPTSNAQDIENETPERLIVRWETYIEEMLKLGIDKKQLMAQSLITPSCGTGSLSLSLATKVLEMTRDVSEQLRKRASL
ncbi:MAG: hypothetical protein N3B18_03695 [Desulfobacterota bacterium]|nr:hypothetical protein [Thermodesulfobacteriota bacterium]